MKTEKSQALIHKLIDNNISREELEELLQKLEDEKESTFLEHSLREHFDFIMNEYEARVRSEKKVENPDKPSKESKINQ